MFSDLLKEISVKLIFRAFIFSGRCADMEIVPGKMLGNSHPCFIIAEVGQNHQGSLQIAKQLIEAAKVCHLVLRETNNCN